MNEETPKGRRFKIVESLQREKESENFGTTSQVFGRDFIVPATLHLHFQSSQRIQ